jgi:hypothetical protein
MLWPDADGGGEVVDGVDAGERAAHGVGVAHVADDQLHFGREYSGRRPDGPWTCGQSASRPARGSRGRAVRRPSATR